MVEPFSIATGTTELTTFAMMLLGGCIKGFILLSTARNLGEDASKIVCLLNIQEANLIEWGRRAGLLTGDGVLDKRLNRATVEETLQTLRNLLTDTDKLKKRYGLRLMTEDGSGSSTSSSSSSDTGRDSVLVQPTQDVSLVNSQLILTKVSDETRTSILKRAKIAQDKGIFIRLRWAAVDKERIEKLVADIHLLVRELWNMLDPWRQDELLEHTRSIASTLVSLNSRFSQLAALNEVLAVLKTGTTQGTPDQELESLAIAARLKALRIGLNDDEQPRQQQEQNRGPMPKRQELLENLKHLSSAKFGSYQAMKKNPTMGFARYDQDDVFVEWKAIDPSTRSKVMQRVENLASLLNVPKDKTFPSLRCHGILERDGNVAFVFEKPQQPKPHAVTLLELFSTKRGIDPPSLTKRVQLALQLLQAVRNFHRTGWLHKNLRSENIVFFPNTDDLDAHAIDSPLLAGFSFSRFASPVEISEQPSEDAAKDIYRHPDAMGEPSMSFSETMDIYSLGTILVEIAEWRAMQYIVEGVVDCKAEDVPLTQLASVRPFLLGRKGKGGTSKLETRMGDLYTSVCIMCLRGAVAEDAQDETVGDDAEHSLLDIAVRRLQECKI